MFTQWGELVESGNYTGDYFIFKDWENREMSASSSGDFVENAELESVRYDLNIEPYTSVFDPQLVVLFGRGWGLAGGSRSLAVYL